MTASGNQPVGQGRVGQGRVGEAYEVLMREFILTMAANSLHAQTRTERDATALAAARIHESTPAGAAARRAQASATRARLHVHACVCASELDGARNQACGSLPYYKTHTHTDASIQTSTGNRHAQARMLIRVRQTRAMQPASVTRFEICTTRQHLLAGPERSDAGRWAGQASSTPAGW